MYDHITLDSIRVAPAASVRRVRRLVTGVNTDGRSIFLEDAPAEHRQVVVNCPTYVYTNLWRHETIPVNNREPLDDGLTGEVGLAPPGGGSILRTVEFPPDRYRLGRPDGPSDLTHTTPSLDYAVVLSGEIWAVLDDEERLMMPGDVLIQRGTRHAWSNRTDQPSIMLFVLIGGTTNTLDNEDERHRSKR